MVTVWHHEACRMVSDCDPGGRIFLSVPNTHGFFFLHTFHFWKWVFDNAVTSIAYVRHIVMTILWWFVTSLRSVTSSVTKAYHDVLYNQCISNRWKFSICTFPTGRTMVCEIRFASTGVICGKLIRYARKELLSGFSYLASEKQISNALPTYWGGWREYVDFPPTFTRETIFVTSCLLSTLNGKKMLSQRRSWVSFLLE